MPLSEEELRLLEQMERALVEEDPKFASTLRGTSQRQSARRRAILAAGCFTTGIVVLMAGAITEVWAVGVVGFVIMLASAYVALTAIKGQQAAASGSAEQRTAGHPSRGFTVIHGGRSARPRRLRRATSGGHFMERMEERWRRRREDNGGF